MGQTNRQGYNHVTAQDAYGFMDRPLDDVRCAGLVLASVVRRHLAGGADEEGDLELTLSQDDLDALAYAVEHLEDRIAATQDALNIGFEESVKVARQR